MESLFKTSTKPVGGQHRVVGVSLESGSERFTRSYSDLSEAAAALSSEIKMADVSPLLLILHK